MKAKFNIGDKVVSVSGSPVGVGVVIEPREDRPIDPELAVRVDFGHSTWLLTLDEITLYDGAGFNTYDLPENSM